MYSRKNPGDIKPVFQRPSEQGIKRLLLAYCFIEQIYSLNQLEECAEMMKNRLRVLGISDAS
jgi:hypothetical protein